MAEAQRVAAEAVAAFNAHDESRIKSLYASDVVFEAPDAKMKGPDEATEYAMSWLRAFPDGRVTVHNDLEIGDWVVHEFTFEGTHEAPLATPEGEIPATHRRLSGRGVEVIRIANGKVAEEHLYFDQVQVMTQLGLMPAAAIA
jgi:steroid delta-isomerase-like uncharacterized protein